MAVSEPTWDIGFISFIFVRLLSGAEFGLCSSGLPISPAVVIKWSLKRAIAPLYRESFFLGNPSACALWVVVLRQVTFCKAWTQFTGVGWKAALVIRQRHALCVCGLHWDPQMASHMMRTCGIWSCHCKLWLCCSGLMQVSNLRRLGLQIKETTRGTIIK